MISVILPTYRREQILVDTLRSLELQLRAGDEILVIDQTLKHEPSTENALLQMTDAGSMRWIRKSTPNQAEAMNVGALLARGEVLLFLDDDIVPSAQLLDAHRREFGEKSSPPATCGQVLQPWNDQPLEQIGDFSLRFNAAFARRCEVVALMAGNFAIRRETFLLVGGMDENYRGSNYRNDSEMAYRIFKRTGQRLRFVPEASIRHLLAAGGNRSFGHKDTWGGIGGSIGDYYFAVRSLSPAAAVAHCVRRFVKEPLNRYTIRHPWLIPSLYARELVAFIQASARIIRKPNNYIKSLADYRDLLPE